MVFFMSCIVAGVHIVLRVHIPLKIFVLIILSSTCEWGKLYLRRKQK